MARLDGNPAHGGWQFAYHASIRGLVAQCAPKRGGALLDMARLMDMTRGMFEEKKNLTATLPPSPVLNGGASDAGQLPSPTP